MAIAFGGSPTMMFYNGVKKDESQRVARGCTGLPQRLVGVGATLLFPGTESLDSRFRGGDWCLVVPLVFKTSVGFARVPGGFDSHSPPPFDDACLGPCAVRTPWFQPGKGGQPLCE